MMIYHYYRYSNNRADISADGSRVIVGFAEKMNVW